MLSVKMLPLEYRKFPVKICRLQTEKSKKIAHRLAQNMREKKSTYFALFVVGEKSGK